MNLMPVTYFSLIYSFTLVIDEIWNNFETTMKFDFVKKA